jgi:hypothetical protein
MALEAARPRARSELVGSEKRMVPGSGVTKG